MKGYFLIEMEFNTTEQRNSILTRIEQNVPASLNEAVISENGKVTLYDLGDGSEEDQKTPIAIGTVVRWKKTDEVGWVRLARIGPYMDIIFVNRDITKHPELGYPYQVFQFAHMNELEVLEKGLDLPEFCAKYAQPESAWSDYKFRRGLARKVEAEEPKTLSTLLGKMSKEELESLIAEVEKDKK